MNISGCIIQNKKIKTNKDDAFLAYYKGKEIAIGIYHGIGKPEFDHLKRFDIMVIDLKSGLLDVNTWKDCHSIRDAIRYALQGACLLPVNREH